MTTAVRTDFLALAQSGAWSQLAETMHGVPSGKWVMEPKYDGARLLALIEEGEVRFFARSGREHSGKFARIAEELSQLPDGTLLDGELVALTEGLCDWGAVQSAMGSTAPPRFKTDGLSYVVFDVLAFDGHDTRALQFKARRKFLEDVFETFAFEAVALTPQLEAARETYEALVLAGWEGAMLKRLDATYASGRRGRGWGRMKDVETHDLVVMGWEDGKDSFTGMIGALVVGEYVDGELVERCKVGTGWKIPERRAMSDGDRTRHIGRVVEVKTYAGIDWRHPVFLRWRDDKTAEECVG